ncbi:MAG: hypothetical protein KKD73_07580 [Proteobacteria bacterium]|nr:hypothetical protein [Pseudomonadota bacterium]MBU1640471.1 hypothetical protein [Pseudomonadota bacterium]
MKHINEIVQEDKGGKGAENCVCNMEWRGTHENEWGDCVCYTEEQKETKKETANTVAEKVS